MQPTRTEPCRTVPSRAEPYRTMQWKSAISVLTYFWLIHPNFDTFRDIPRYTVNSIIWLHSAIPPAFSASRTSWVILRCFATSATSAAALPLRDNWCVITEAAPVSKCFRCETAFSFPRWLVGLVTLYISDERWAEIALRDWEIASLSQSVELRQAASSQIVHLNIK